MKPETGRRPRIVDDSEVEAIATSFVEARLQSRPLANYPGRVPDDLATAYRCQDAAIELWPDRIAGWKVGRIPEALEERFASDRLAGPIFATTIQYANGEQRLESPVYPGGFAAIEAEFVIVVKSDAPAGKLEWSREEASEMIRDLRIVVETASSPLRSINDLGPAAIVSDFGNNAGLIVGPSITDWQSRELESMSCEAFIEGKSVGKGGAFRLSGGPIRSLQFMLDLAARRQHEVRGGLTAPEGVHQGIGGPRVSVVEDHAPGLEGNARALIAASDHTVEAQGAQLMDALSWHGFGMFDIKVHEDTGEAYFLEMNPRLGRHHYYLTVAGANPAAYLHREFVEKSAHPAPFTTQSPAVSTTIPLKLVHQYASAEQQQLLDEAKRARRIGWPLQYSKDRNLKRDLYQRYRLTKAADEVRHTPGTMNA